MYQVYLAYQVNKTRKEYIGILSNVYPKDKNRFKLWRYNQLRAVYIAYLKRRDSHGKEIKDVGVAEV